MVDVRVEDRDKFILSRTKELSDKLLAKTAVSKIFSDVRFILFLAAFIIGGLFLYLKLPIFAYISFAVLLTAFIVIAIIHSKYKESITRLEAVGIIHSEYMARVGHEFDKLPDSGEDFKDKNHDFSDDLDLFGKHSMFHLITVAQTWFGRTTLAEYLKSAQRKDKTSVEICLRQEAVRELSTQIPVLQEFQAAGRLSKQSAVDPTALLAYVSDEEGRKPLVSLLFCILSAVITAAFLVTALISALGIISYIFPALIVLLQIVFIAIKYEKFKPVFASVNDYYSELAAYAELFEDLEKSHFTSQILVDTRNILLCNGSNPSTSASRKVHHLHRICLFMQVRSQPILFFILNVLFLYDNYCIYFLEKWKKQSGSQLESFLKALGTWEAIASLTTLSIIYPECSFPTFVDDTKNAEKQAFFSATKMGHPLIPVNKQIRNDFCLSEGIALITGSNMSGKTTLLRTVGINAVLAYAGTICCADSVTLGLMQLGSSMRIADDLGEGLSTFYSELLRIEKIISKANAKEPLLFLIDEIFRGTNSRDRTDGAKIVLQNLSRNWIIGIMSTHDYELCSYEFQNGIKISNYHFSESYDDLGIHFDYHLSSGISESTNARYLMKMIGIN